MSDTSSWHAYQVSKEKLRFALISRVLTEDEMDDVMSLGISLFVDDGVSYKPAEKYRQLADALYAQARLRRLEKLGEIDG